MISKQKVMIPKQQAMIPKQQVMIPKQSKGNEVEAKSYDIFAWPFQILWKIHAGAVFITPGVFKQRTWVAFKVFAQK